MTLTILAGDFFREAIDYIRESLANYSEEKWKLSVLHAAMALEMALKERLVSINPALVLSNIDDEGCKHTVSVRQAVKRLKNLRVKIDKSNVELITTIAAWRDGVAHHRAEFTHSDAKSKLGSIYKYFTRFLEKELGKNIKDSLETKEYHQYKELLKEWDEIVKEAQEAAAKESYVHKVGSLTFDCEECWGTDTLVLRDEKAHCHLCNNNFDYEACLSCGNPVIGSRGGKAEGGGVFCEACIYRLMQE